MLQALYRHSLRAALLMRYTCPGLRWSSIPHAPRQLSLFIRLSVRSIQANARRRLLAVYMLLLALT